MKKISIILTLLATFFIGNISANAERVKATFKSKDKDNVSVNCNYTISTNTDFTIKLNMTDSEQEPTLSFYNKNGLLIKSYIPVEYPVLNDFKRLNDTSTKELNDYKCPDIYYNSSEFNTTNLKIYSTENDGASSLKSCYYKYEKANLPALFKYTEYKYTNETLDSSWTKSNAVINSENECKEYFKREKKYYSSIYAGENESGICIICELSDPKWINAFYGNQQMRYQTDLLSEFCGGKSFTITDNRTKKACEEKNESSKVCYICNPDSKDAYGLWIEKGKESSKCSNTIFSPGEHTENDCIEEGKKYSIANGGTGENISNYNSVSCGKGTLKNIPSRLIKIINTIVKVIQIGVPVLLIIFGMIDFAKAAMAQKEDEMKKGQKIFVSRLITAILVFLVIFIVKIAVRFVNESNDSSKIISCIDCFINGDCE